MGIAKGATKVASVCHKLVDILGGLGKIIGEVDFGLAQAAQLVNRDLEAILVFVEQAFDLEEVILLEGVDGVLDVVPHLGFDLAAAVAESQREVGFAGFLGLNLLGNDHETGSDDFVFVVIAIR